MSIVVNSGNEIQRKPSQFIQKYLRLLDLSPKVQYLTPLTLNSNKKASSLPINLYKRSFPAFLHINTPTASTLIPHNVLWYHIVR